MITLKTENFNYPSQKKYDYFINHLNLYNLKCSCEVRGQCKRHAYYTRSIKTPFGKVRLRILRVICASCGKTHAILLDSIVPYSQVVLKDHIEIIMNMEEKKNMKHIMERCPEIEECNITYILNTYRRHWKERICSISPQIIKLLKEINVLITSAFSRFQLNFMQIRYTYNSLQSLNHTR